MEEVESVLAKRGMEDKKITDVILNKQFGYAKKEEDIFCAEKIMERDTLKIYQFGERGLEMVHIQVEPGTDESIEEVRSDIEYILDNKYVGYKKNKTLEGSTNWSTKGIMIELSLGSPLPYTTFKEEVVLLIYLSEKYSLELTLKTLKNMLDEEEKLKKAKKKF